MESEGLISLEGMRFHAYHGCFEKEKTEGGEFIVDVTLLCDTGKAVKSDDLADTVDVQEVYRAVADQMAAPSNLIEHAAGRILEAVCTLPGTVIRRTAFTVTPSTTV